MEERFEDAAFLRDTAGTGLVSFNFYFEEKNGSLIVVLSKCCLVLWSWVPGWMVGWSLR